MESPSEDLTEEQRQELLEVSGREVELCPRCGGDGRCGCCKGCCEYCDGVGTVDKN